MALSDMFGLLGGGGSDPLDIYGDLFTPQQKAALQQRQSSEGLLRLAGAFGAAAQPSRLPTSFMGTLGQAAGAMAGGTGEETALKGMELAEKVKQARAERAILAKAAPLVEAITKRLIGAGVPAAQATQIATQVAGGAAAAPAVPQPAGAPPIPGSGGPNAPPPPPGAPPGMTASATAADAAMSAPSPQPSAPGRGDYQPAAPGAPLDVPSPFGAPAPPRVTGKGVMPPGGLITPDDYSRYLGITPTGPQQNAGLLPPPPDQMVGPDGQPLTGQGVLPTMAASYGGAPGGMPPFRRASSTPGGGAIPGAGADEWLRQNAPFPVQGRARPPGAYAQGFTYDEPKVPFGQDPGDFLPGRRPSTGTPVALAGSAWEQANNNLGGLRRPGVNAGPSQGGFQSFATPEAGVAAISKQLDRYASGATTGKPLTTVREIVSTWAPPNENPTATLINRAAKTLGVDPDTSLDVSNPAVKAKLIEATIRNEQGGKLPIDQQIIERVAAMQPDNRDFVVSSGRGVPTSALRRVADTGAPPVSPGVAGAPAGGGFLPGTDIRPEELAALNAMLKMGGIKSDPFGSLLETYYKSPNYITEAARARALGENDPLIIEQKKRTEFKIETELKPALEAAVATAMNAPLAERAKAQAAIDRETKRLEQAGAAGTKIEEATVAGDDGKPVQKKMTALEIAIRERLTAERRAAGDTTVRPGDIVGTPALSPGETVTQQKSAELPYTTKDMELTWPDGETRKVTVTGQQAKDIAEGRPVPAIGWPGSAAGGAAMPADDRPRGGATVYPPGHAEATTVMLKERRPKAEAAIQSLQFNETAKRLLDAGIISGYGAGLRLDVAKAKSLLGWDDARIANTEAFLATQTRQVAAALASGAFGSGSSITEEDRRQAANMVGQNAALDEKSLRFLVNLNDAAANWEIDRYEADRQKHDPKGRLPILRVDRPPKQEAKPSANQPTPVGSAKIGDTPYTKWSDGKWRPVGELPGEEK